MLDHTLETFLLQELPCQKMDAADHVALAAVDVPGNKTLANEVVQGSFEHIRLRLTDNTEFSVICELIRHYYREIGSETAFEHLTPSSILMRVDTDDNHLTVIATMETEEILNVAVS